jgi:uncharacterized protein YuzE
MKVNYYRETDLLYIGLSERPSAESREISEGVGLDYDEAGNLVGIDIDNASGKVELGTLVISKLPAGSKRYLADPGSVRPSGVARRCPDGRQARWAPGAGRRQKALALAGH